MLSPSSDYTDRDFDALRIRLFNLIRSVNPQWTDENVANFGNTILDSFCFTGDVLAKYLDNAALNSRWSTATQLRAILASVALIGYTPQGQTASNVEETFTLGAVTAGDVVLPAGTIVRTLDVNAPILYQLLAALTIPAGTTTAQGLVENSSSETDTFDSSGLLSQSVILSGSPFLQTSEQVTAGNGLYARVANFLSSEPTDLVYTLRIDANGVATITFGNGVLGAPPTGQITVVYKYGGGAAGVVGQATLVSLPGSYTDVLGNPVQIAVTNPLGSSPAQDAQSVASIQQLAPLSLRPAGRAIARTDYQDVALQVPGVARALMLFRNQDPAVMVNQGVLRIVTPGATPASAALLAAVAAAFVATPYSGTLNLLIVTGSYLPVNIQVSAYKTSGTTPAALKASLIASIQYLFAVLIPATDLAGNPNAAAGKPNPLIDFGFNLQNATGNPSGTLDWSDVFDACRNAAGVRKINATGLQLNGVAADVAIAVSQFPALGTITIIDADTNTEL
jgi:hypothetical protein